MKKDYTENTDSELIEIISKKRKDSNYAFSELYDRYSVQVRNFCSFMIQNREQTEDIFQESFIIFYNHLIEGKQIENGKGYLLSIARNLCLKFFRDKKPTVDFEPDSFFIDESSKYESNEMFGLITKALQLLDDIYREAFILREFDGLSYKEIAEICNTSVTNAKSRVFRAHKQIIDILQPYLKDLAK